jgi:PHD/YefM family antitoxin component YafN of YafNO toxin-antitoxin module
MVRESNEPVYLTKNGYGEMIVMSIRAYEQQLKEQEIRLKLMEAEYEAACTNERYTHEEVMGRLNNLIDKAE